MVEILDAILACCYIKKNSTVVDDLGAILAIPENSLSKISPTMENFAILAI